MFKNMGGNIPGGNFLGGNYPEGIHQGDIWWMGVFRVRVFGEGERGGPDTRFVLFIRDFVFLSLSLKLYLFTVNIKLFWDALSLVLSCIQYRFLNICF